MTISRRPWFGVCAGVCPNYNLTVWVDGRILAVQRNLDGPDEVERFRVPQHEASKFRALLSPFRPAGFRRTQPKCKHPISFNEAPLVNNVTEIDIRWSGSSSRLVACDNAEDAVLIEALNAALRTVHLNIDASHS